MEWATNFGVHLDHLQIILDLNQKLQRAQASVRFVAVQEILLLPKDREPLSYHHLTVSVFSLT